MVWEGRGKLDDLGFSLTEIHHGWIGRKKSSTIPTQKPVELMRRPILNHTRRGESVYDPFLGSGTTLAAAEITERVCYGLEIDARYIDTIITRWQNLTGGKAILEGDGRTFMEIAAEREQVAV